MVSQRPTFAACLLARRPKSYSTPKCEALYSAAWYPTPGSSDGLAMACFAGDRNQHLLVCRWLGADAISWLGVNVWKRRLRAAAEKVRKTMSC